MFYYLILWCHWDELYLFLLFGFFDESCIREEGQGYPFITVATCSTHPMDISRWTYLISILWLVIINNQRNRPYIYPSSNSLSPEQHLYLLIPQLRHPLRLRSRTIIRMYMLFPHLTNRRTLPMYIIHIQIILTRLRRLLIIQIKLPFLHQYIKLP